MREPPRRGTKSAPAPSFPLAETVGLMARCAAGELLAGPRMPVTTEPLRMLFPPR